VTTVASRADPEAPVAAATVGAARPPMLLSGLLALLAIALVGVAFAVAEDGTLDAVAALRVGLVVAWIAAGLALARRSGLERLGQIVLVGTVAGAASTAGALARSSGWEGGGRTVATGALVLGCTTLGAAVLHFLVALPRGVVDNARRRVTIGGYVVATAAGAAAWATTGRWPAWAGWSLWLAALAAGLPLANRMYVRSAGLDRQRLQWFGCGAAVAIEGAVVVVALRVLVDWPHDAAVVAAWCTAIIPIAAMAAASRLATRVDRALVHTVSLTGLTSVVVSIYLVVVVGLGRVPEDAERQLLALSMLAAAVAAGTYLPARRRLAELANRLVYGERQAPDEVLRTFGTRLTRAVPMDELLLQLAESLRKTMSLTRAEVWTGTAEHLERAVSVPRQPTASLIVGPKERPVVGRAGVFGNGWLAVWLPAMLAGRENRLLRVAPCCHSGELLGLIVVERAGEADPFGDEDDRVLGELARQVGLALHNVELDSALQESLDEVRRQAEELRASRARIVATADAERRKIERNLHDGAQQHLVALAVTLRLVKDIVGDDPGAAAEMLDQLAVDVKTTIQELRDLAHGIYPPLLMDSGLAEALRAAATRSPLAVDVDAGGVGRFPTEVEAAIYFCCLEALQNAAKHAPGAHVDVRVWQDGADLRFQVADDGPGFDVAAATHGHGFVNMSDRLGAIGGTVTWDSTPGSGSRVSGAVPLEPVETP
jgi:signal transduction histidine kinase